MKTLRFMIYAIIVTCLLISGPAQAQATASGSAGVSQGKGQAGIWSRPEKMNESQFQGRIAYINRITGQIIVADENNVKRPVRISPLQMRRLRVGQSVDISLRDGGAAAWSIRTGRSQDSSWAWRAP